MSYKKSGFVVEWVGESMYLHIDKITGQQYFRPIDVIYINELVVEQTVKDAEEWADAHLRVVDAEKDLEVKKFRQNEKYTIESIN